MIFYELECWMKPKLRTIREELASEAEAHVRAKAFSLEHGECRVITWVRSPNLRGAKPDFVDRSSAMSIWRNGERFDAYIHRSRYEEWPHEEKK